MRYYYISLLMFFFIFNISAQDLHIDNNAISANFEVNSTDGWYGAASLSSVSETPAHGSFCFLAQTTASNERDIRYNFSAVISEEYNISIWAKVGTQSSKPAFANWQGFQGFRTTTISGTEWREYSFTLTATSSNPEIRIYLGSSKGSVVGDHIYIDNISIISSSPSDSDPPASISDLSSSNISFNSLVLNWSEPQDNVGVVNYEVFQDDISIGFTSNTSFTIGSGLAPDISYSFSVIAIDASGNRSSTSNTEIVRTLPDTESPNPIVDLSPSSLTFNTVNLSWTEPNDNVGVTDYEVFKNSESLGFTGGSTTYNVIGLIPNTSYNFTVFAVDSAGNRSISSNILILDTPVAPDSQNPDAIGDLTATNIGVNSVDLNWTEPFDNVGVVSYEIFKDGSIIGLTSNTFFLINSELIPNSSYSFNVVAIDPSGNRSSLSNSETVITLADTEPPSPVLDLSSSSLTFNSVDLEWTEPNDNIGVTDYEVFKNSESIGFTSGSTTLHVSGLVPNTNFNFVAIAVDAAGNRSGSSNVLNLDTPEGPDMQNPEAIDDLNSSNTSMTSTTLSWTTPFDNVGVAQYDIFLGINLITSTIASSFVVNDLLPGSNYSFSVVAIDAVGNESSKSNIVDVTTLEDIESPSIITDLNVSNITLTSANLGWSPATDNLEIKGYDIYRNSSLIAADQATTVYSDSGLDSDTPYSYYVVAKDISGNSTQSNTVNIQTLDAIVYNDSNANLNTIDWVARDLFANRNLGIGTTNTQGFRLAVNGNIIAEEIKVALQSNWPDFVFFSDYKLPTIEEVENYISKNGHLMNIPNADEVMNSGYMIGEMNAKLLQKIEELTLYTIDQNSRIKELEAEQKRIQSLLILLLELKNE